MGSDRTFPPQEEVRTVYSRPLRERRAANAPSARPGHSAGALDALLGTSKKTAGGGKEHALALRQASAQAARRRAGAELRASEDGARPAPAAAG